MVMAALCHLQNELKINAKITDFANYCHEGASDFRDAKNKSCAPVVPQQNERRVYLNLLSSIKVSTHTNIRRLYPNKLDRIMI